MKPKINLCVFSQKRNVIAMQHNITFFVFMLLGTSLVGCEQPKEETPTVPQPIIEIIPDQSQDSEGKSFLDQRREIVDYDEKFLWFVSVR